MPKYLTVILLFCLGKWWHRTANAETLRFLLAPTDTAVSAATGKPGIWQPELGYYHPALNMAIDASCAGFNFLLITFLLLTYLLLQRYDRWWAIPLALLAAWPVTLAANTSRILTILLTGDAPRGFSAGIWHEGQGAFVYLFVLTGTGLLLSYWLNPTNRITNTQPSI